MRLSKFHQLMNDEFGAGFAAVLLNDLILSEFSDKNALAAIKAGEDPRKVWLAICQASDVPKEYWQGRNTPKRAQ